MAKIILRFLSRRRRQCRAEALAACGNALKTVKGFVPKDVTKKQVRGVGLALMYACTRRDKPPCAARFFVHTMFIY